MEHPAAGARRGGFELRRLPAAAALLAALAALAGCGDDGNDATATSSTTATASVPSDRDSRAVTPGGADISLTPGPPLRLSVGTAFGDSCTTLTRPLEVTFEERGDNGLITIGTFEATRPGADDRVCAQVAQRITTEVNLPSSWSEGTHELTAMLGGQTSTFRIVDGARPRLIALDTTNVTLGGDQSPEG